MIIAGNSHVSIFRSRLKYTRSDKPVTVKWVGAITAGHFLKNHSSARAIRSLFSQTYDWKFLSIGMHDIFLLCKAHVENRYEQTFGELIGLYKSIFLELNSKGNFGWLISPQQLNGSETYGITEDRIFDFSRKFNKKLTDWCVEKGIVVINPLNNILDKNNLPKDELLQIDGIHLNDTAIEYYIKEINDKTDEDLGFVLRTQSRNNVLYAETEPESLSLLVADELGLLWDQTKLPHGGRKEFEDELVKFISDLLAKKGVDISIERDTDYNYNNKLRSVDLVEIYTFANGLVGDEINFDVNIRELTTVENISEFIFKNKPLTKNDFFETLTPDTTDKIRYSETLLSDWRIAEMRDNMYLHLKEIIHLQTGGVNFAYGIIYFWFALIEAKRGNYGLALSLLQNAEDLNLRFPFQSLRIEYYKHLWKEKLIEHKSGLKIKHGIKANKTQVKYEHIDLWWPEGKFVYDEDDLLLEFKYRGKDITDKIETLYAAGVYDLNKCRLYFDLFKNLRKIYLFMPVPDVYEQLKKAVHTDTRVEVFPYGLTDTNGYDLLVMDINASSLTLYMGKQINLISGKAISVECRSLENLVSSHDLPLPDMLVFNIHGMEHQFYSSISPEFLSEIKINYFATGKDVFCHGSIPNILFQRLFEEHFEYFGFAPLRNSDEQRGNVLFLNRHYMNSIHELRQKQTKILKKNIPASVLKRKPNLVDQSIDSRITEIVESLYKHGEALLNDDNIDDAFSAFAMTIEISPDHAMAFYHLGMLLWKQKKMSEAGKCFNRAFHLDVSNKTIASSFANFSIATGDPEQAKKIFRLCLRHNPDDKTLVELLSSIDGPRQKVEADSLKIIYQNIRVLLETGRTDEAMKALEKLIEDFPKCALAYNDLGVLFCQRGNTEKALKHYETAVRLEPENITFQKNTADFYYFVLGRVEEALQIYTNVLVANPEDIEILLIMGRICVSLEQFDSAKVFYKRTLEVDPENPDAAQGLDSLANGWKTEVGRQKIQVRSQ